MAVTLPSIGWCVGSCTYSCPLQLGEEYFFNIEWGEDVPYDGFLPFGEPYCTPGGCSRDVINQIQ